MALEPSDDGPIRYESLGGEVTARLRQSILSGRLKDGDRIVERDIAAWLGVSRGPIRDAFRQLEHEGLVVVLPRRGARVASLTLDDAIEVLAIRSALEPVAVERLLDRDDPEVWQKSLEDCLRRLRRASRKSDGSAIVSLDMEFHETIFQLAGGKRLMRIWESLRVPLLQTFRVHREFYDSPEMVYERHRGLLE